MGRIVVEQIVSLDGYAEDAVGGIDFFCADEVDVLRLRVLPLLVGSGRSFSPSGVGVRRLSLASAQAFAGGLVVLEYHAAS
jgi:hypothetical protein